MRTSERTREMKFQLGASVVELSLYTQYHFGVPTYIVEQYSKEPKVEAIIMQTKFDDRNDAVAEFHNRGMNLVSWT